MGNECGFAVPTVMLIMVAALALASAAALASISAQRGTTRDQSSKSAFAVAESGVSDAMLRFNLTAAPSPCSPVSSQGPDTNGWCPQVGPVSAVDGGTFTYWVHPPSSAPSSRCAASSSSSACMEIVSVGALAGVTRRVDETANSSSGQQMFADGAVKAQNGITMASNSEIHSGAATNGDMTLSSNAKQCGPASVGVGRQLTTTANAKYYSDTACTQLASSYTQQALNLPPVNQGNAPSHNDNGRFFTLDSISGNKADACWNGFNGNGAAGSCGARELSVSNNSSLTIAGSIYSLCKLSLSANSKLYVSAGANVVIYFDSPEACGQSSGTTQLQLASNTRISPATTAPTSVALLFVGSTSRSTTASLNSNTDVNAFCQQNFVVYGPLTDINLNSNSDYCGAMAGKTIALASNALVQSGSGTASFVLPGGAPYYVLNPGGYVECSAISATPPNSGC